MPSPKIPLTHYIISNFKRVSDWASPYNVIPIQEAYLAFPEIPAKAVSEILHNSGFPEFRRLYIAEKQTRVRLQEPMEIAQVWELLYIEWGITGGKNNLSIVRGLPAKVSKVMFTQVRVKDVLTIPVKDVYSVPILTPLGSLYCFANEVDWGLPSQRTQKDEYTVDT